MLREKEKMELKLEILRDLESCIHCDFFTTKKEKPYIDLEELWDLITKYENILKGIDLREEEFTRI